MTVLSSRVNVKSEEPPIYSPAKLCDCFQKNSWSELCTFSYIFFKLDCPHKLYKKYVYKRGRWTKKMKVISYSNVLFFEVQIMWVSSQFKIKLLLQSFHWSIYQSRIFIFHFVCPDILAIMAHMFSYQIPVSGLLLAMLRGLSVTISSRTTQFSHSGTFPDLPLHLTSLKYKIIL